MKLLPRVAILTRHDVPNYGSFLQTLATQRIMEELSLKPTIINYKREDDSTDALIKQYCKDHNNIIFKMYYQTLWRYSHSHINRVMKNARETYLHCSIPVDKSTIKDILQGYDLYMTGSDQVWNVVGSGNTKEIDPVYFWNDLSAKDKVFSYAASFGDVSLSHDDFLKCQKGLAKFKHISVRENTAVSLVNRMGYDAEQVLDPTLLVDENYWNELANKSKIQMPKKYALVYNLHSNSNMKEYIVNDLKCSNLDVFSITTTFRKGIGKTVFCPPIQDFLYLFKNASCIYADSFHAIAFSIIFNTPIVVTLPVQYSTRLESILELFELEDCIKEKKHKDSWDETRIDWNRVNAKLKKERLSSREWLRTVVDNMISK